MYDQRDEIPEAERKTLLRKARDIAQKAFNEGRARGTIIYVPVLVSTGIKRVAFSAAQFMPLD